MKFVYKSRWILPKGGVVVENGAIVVEDGKITAILDQADSVVDAEVVDFGNSVLTPGFINLHTHLQYTDIGKKQPKCFANRLKRLFLKSRKWWYLTPHVILNPRVILNLIQDLFKPSSQKQTPSFISWITDLMSEYICWSREEKLESFRNGLDQILLSGTTTVAQLSGEEIFFDVLNDSPIRSYIFMETFATTEEMAEKSFNNFREKYEKLSPKCNQNVYLGASPHSVYNVHKSLWEKISEYASKNDVLIQMHFAESKEEMQWLKTGLSDIEKLHKFIGIKPLKPFKTGLKPVEYLKELNLPKENLILAHLNQLDEAEIAELGASVAHCPRSNMLLHGKTIDADKVERIGLGTDSLYSNYDLNILNEARFVLDEGVELAKVFDMLTINAAKALKVDAITGSLEPDKQADFLVFRLNEGEGYSDFIKKDCPDRVYISGKIVVEEKKLKT